jgi:hypothetical protein
MVDVKLLKRGKYYLTPLRKDHLPEIHKHLSQENKRELKLLGYENIMDALEEMQEYSECYLARKEGEPFLFVGGLWYSGGDDMPQMFAMFSDQLKDNFTAIARGSRMLMDYLDQTNPNTTMTILAEYEHMIQWATWLGYEPVGVAANGAAKYVEFVRCKYPYESVYDDTSRPVMH